MEGANTEMISLYEIQKIRMMYSMFQINIKTADDATHLTIFAIPKSKESEFLTNPELVWKSLSAKALYTIESSKYENDQQRWDAEIDKQFDDYVTYMMGLTSLV